MCVACDPPPEQQRYELGPYSLRASLQRRRKQEKCVFVVAALVRPCSHRQHFPLCAVRRGREKPVEPGGARPHPHRQHFTLRTVRPPGRCASNLKQAKKNKPLAAATGLSHTNHPNAVTQRPASTSTASTSTAHTTCAAPLPPCLTHTRPIGYCR